MPRTEATDNLSSLATVGRLPRTPGKIRCYSRPPADIDVLLMTAVVMAVRANPGMAMTWILMRMISRLSSNLAGPEGCDSCRPLYRRRGSGPLSRPLRHKASGEGGTYRRCASSDAENERESGRSYQSKSSMRFAPKFSPIDLSSSRI